VLFSDVENPRFESTGGGWGSDRDPRAPPDVVPDESISLTAARQADGAVIHHWRVLEGRAATALLRSETSAQVFRSALDLASARA